MSRSDEVLIIHKEAIRAMETLNLSSSQAAVLMGVNRPTIDEWLLYGVPSEHAAKLGVIIATA